MSKTPDGARRGHLSVVPDVPAVPPNSERNKAATYTVRVVLDDVSPPIWRQFTVPSDVVLPQLHNIVQDVMGWNDSHLHLFFLGADPYRGGPRYVMRVTLEDDDAGVVEDDVRVDQLLSAVGDELGYEYDFGDGWGHRLTLESITAGTGVVECLDGDRACPPEDCGGPSGYVNLLRVLADPSDEEHEYLKVWSSNFDATHFDVAEVNERIFGRARQDAVVSTVNAQSPKLAGLLRTAPLPWHTHLPKILEQIDFGQPTVDLETASAALQKLTWFLDRVGPAGITLTGAGYLPPRHVAAMKDELTWSQRWYGSSTREGDNPEAQILRGVVQGFGLTKVRKGALQLTKPGAALAADPVRLWEFVTTRMPLGKERFEIEAGTLLLASVAAGVEPSACEQMMSESMSLLNWQGDMLEPKSVRYVPRQTLDVLRLIGAISLFSSRDDGPPEQWARQFATDCLRR